MQSILPKIEGINMQKHEHDHDFSKDDLFLFAAPCYFDGGLKEPEMKQFMEEELERHYRLEPHHPEYEKFHGGKECSKEDILEMAIDRLARNIQFGVMEKFKPNFPLGDNGAKQAWFWENVLKHKDFVQHEFMYPDAKEWVDKQS